MDSTLNISVLNFFCLRLQIISFQLFLYSNPKTYNNKRTYGTVKQEFSVKATRIKNINHVLPSSFLQPFCARYM